MLSKSAVDIIMKRLLLCKKVMVKEKYSWRELARFYKFHVKENMLQWFGWHYFLQKCIL